VASVVRVECAEALVDEQAVEPAPIRSAQAGDTTAAGAKEP
jgi:hypothetical protein